MHWLEKIVPSIGLLIGIVFVAAGATMLFSSLLKVVTYDTSPRAYYYDCPSLSPVKEGVSEEITPESEEACRARVAKDERIRYRAEKKDMMINGGVLLFIGGIFWSIFSRKKKN